MAPETSTKMTYEDLLLLPDDGLRHEIIDGEHYVNASPITRHQRVSMRIIAEILFYLREHPVGELFHAPFDVVFSRYDVVDPDLIFISNARRDIVTVKNIQGAPDLLVEILSQSNRRDDEVTKQALYERTGVGEYWIVDPARDVVRVFRRNAAGRYERAAELSENDTLTSPLFPTLEIQLQSVFSD
ncbi:MAG TPA: Uma2 family endonuclease [Thermoanaerobaculia bacterium]|jgi:Uma2 family endonuclease|nr:Uma2 family endonuclease [Thermoanaerobaculia bacterium]